MSQINLIKFVLLANASAGYHVILDSRESADALRGMLEPLPPELGSSLHNWQLGYRSLEGVRNAATIRGIEVGLAAQYSPVEEKNAVKNCLNEWLEGGDSGWLKVRFELNAIAGRLENSGGEICFFLDVEDHQLARIPWQEWDLLQDQYPQAEVAIRVRGRDDIQPILKYDRVRILVVVGQSQGINTESDLNVLRNLEEKGAEVVILNQPTRRELQAYLREEKGYHIFVYTGHSSSDEEGKIGYIELNDAEEPLSIDEFKLALKEAIKKGLQLAIFNSCDGFGLAHQLAKLNLPRILVMREPVPDQVAVEFLKYFFEKFSQNKSLFSSVNQAKENLEHWEGEYPGAMWLPTICIRESALDQPLLWENLIDKTKPPVIEEQPDKNPPVTEGNNPAGKSKNLAIFWLFFSLLGLAILGLGMIIIIPKNKEPIVSEQSSNKDFTDVAVPTGTWRYGGSTSTAVFRDTVNSRIKQVLPQFNLSYYDHPTLPPGSGTGIKMLLDNQIAFAESSRPLNQEELAAARNQGFQLRQVAVAIDALGVIVNPSLEVDNLNMQQLKDIYTGKITNWNEVGGPNLEIVPLSRHPDAGGTPEFFQHEILGEEKFSDRVIWTYNTTQGVQEVSKVPGGIYYGSASEVIPQCQVKPISINFVPSYQGSLVLPENCPQQRNQINFEAFKNEQYPLTRRLFVIIKEDGGLDQQGGEAYYHLLLTDEGQQLIKEAGYIPLR
ncbi:MAG: substrate-binding domain-containing protein [Gomphosphaeria aponina SAG 52.96 = DSM 107014]|uniref:Substrate-binding domain-containing protein n=1 Tax=Gomphosphaeria aponina SAG 52.96 = DSM 107014 TaxID=1521640 RepID=A0A941GUZ2_9CHRO|nr:substrate-binding domain-containing protein [Gomphosphaeria aponina SAG 52.96 = DSM 107014]